MLDNTLWFAYNADASEFTRRDDPAVLDTVIAAGARSDVYPEMPKDLGGAYRRAGKERPET